jgi:hypothetical protein
VTDLTKSLAERREEEIIRLHAELRREQDDAVLWRARAEQSARDATMYRENRDELHKVWVERAGSLERALVAEGEVARLRARVQEVEEALRTLREVAAGIPGVPDPWYRDLIHALVLARRALASPSETRPAATKEDHHG